MSEREEYARIKVELAENERKLAYNMGRIDQIYDGLRTDPEHVENLRALAWTRAGCETLHLQDDRIAGLPDGWPAGVNADEFISEDIAVRKAQHEPRPKAARYLPNDCTVLPAVRRFRMLLV